MAADDCRVIIVNQHISYKGLDRFLPSPGDMRFRIIGVKNKPNTKIIQGRSPTPLAFSAIIFSMVSSIFWSSMLSVSSSLSLFGLAPVCSSVEIICSTKSGWQNWRGLTFTNAPTGAKVLPVRPSIDGSDGCDKPHASSRQKRLLHRPASWARDKVDW